MIFFSAIFVLLMLGVLFWITPSEVADLRGKVIGGVLIAAGIMLVVPFAVAREKTATSRRLLRKHGRRIDACINEVVNEGGTGGMYYYHLEVRDLNNGTHIFKSDPIPGSFESLKFLLDYARDHGRKNEMTVPVYVDPTDETKYFVDVSSNVELILKTKLGI